MTKDQYGNYVISHVLEHGKYSDKEFVIKKMKRKVLELSIHKFGSNVIEKCLIHSDVKQRTELLSEILSARLNAED